MLTIQSLAPRGQSRWVYGGDRACQSFTKRIEFQHGSEEAVRSRTQHAITFLFGLGASCRVDGPAL